MILTANTRALAVGCSNIFTASGGQAPYAYYVLPNGLGGSINISTGVYTAPLAIGDDPKKNVDTIRAVDSLGAAQTLTVMVGSPLELVCDIIAKYMALTADQIYIWDQKFNIPKDYRAYLAASILSSRVFSSNISYEDQGAGLNAVQQTNVTELVQIDIYSKSTEANRRKYEIVRALKSVYAQFQMENNNFSVSSIPANFVTVNSQEGAAIPYRFNITIAVQHMETQGEDVNFYDQFADPQVIVENQGDEG